MANLEEQCNSKVSEIEEIWTQRYAQVRKHSEKLSLELKGLKQKQIEIRARDMETLEQRGKSMGSLMDEAMKLIRQAQEDSFHDRLRLGSGLLKDDDLLNNLGADKENPDIPSPSQIRASYTQKIPSSIVVPTGGSLTPRCGSLGGQQGYNRSSSAHQTSNLGRTGIPIYVEHTTQHQPLSQVN